MINKTIGEYNKREDYYKFLYISPADYNEEVRKMIEDKTDLEIIVCNLLLQGVWYLTPCRLEEVKEDKNG